MTEDGLNTTDPSSYRFQALGPADYDRYEALLRKVYENAEIFSESFIPGRDATRYGLFTKHGELAGICATRTVGPDRREWFIRHIGNGSVDAWDPMVEILNFVVERSHHSGVAFYLMCYSVAKEAKAAGGRTLVGITRFATLKSFMRFGLDVAKHEPLHVLGRQDINDYIVYYDLHNPRSVEYMHQRATRLFNQTRALAELASANRDARKQVTRRAV